MKKSRILSLLLVFVLTMSFVLSSCGSSTDSSESTSESASAESQATADADSDAAAAEKYLHTSKNGIETNDSGYMRTELTALELTKLMGNGINLGNTMEAYGHSTLGTDASVTSYETYWGQPVTTQEIVSGMKAAGFDTLRIPVAWTNMMDYESGDYTIDEAYLDRVEEIINYALNEDMYVIINDHWDGGWWGMFGSADEDTRNAAMEMYIAMWTQIAERYEEYSDYLIFESANEELGNRLNDTDVAADSGTLSTDECYEMTNLINQTFVDTIRATGGNNEYRFLLIAGYGTDIESTIDSRFEMPTDTATSKLLLSVHYYTPSNYCIFTSLSQWGTRRNFQEMNALLSYLTQFTDQGYGIVIGEYGVLEDADGNAKSGIIEYLSNFLDNCDLYNYCPVLWDCNWMYQRTTQTILVDEVADLYASRSYAAQSSMTDEEIQAAAQAEMDALLDAAPTSFSEDAVDISDASTAIAWIMYSSSDWSVTYSVGDSYDADSKTDGVVATDVEITGAGTYTVALDFSGTSGGYADGTVFSALAVGNGELLFADYVINITEILVNGEAISLVADPYTTSDDSKCTRVNLYNSWVSAIPDGIRTVDGNTSNVSPCIIDPDDLAGCITLEITFEYGPAE